VVTFALVLTAGSAHAQSFEPTVVRNPDDTVPYTFDFGGLPRGTSTVFGFSPPNYYFFDPLNPLAPGGGCQWLSPDFRKLVICPPPIRGFGFRLGQGPNQLLIPPNVPKAPGPNLIQGGLKKDNIKGGRSDEKVKSGKGNDAVNPGPGKDQVNLGAGNDKANTKDGEVDVLNGGKGRDAATVDKKDKVKNVEKVKRR
jgi:hypothetical protein